MSFLEHNMTPREPYDPSLHKSQSWHDFAPDHRLRHLTIAAKNEHHNDGFDVRRGHLGEKQSLDGQSISFEDSPKGKQSRAVSRSSSQDSFYLGGGTWDNDRKPRGIRDLGALFNDANDPRISAKKCQSRDELLYYEAKQKQERLSNADQKRNQRDLEKDFTGLVLETKYSRQSSRRSSAGSISNFAIGNNPFVTAEERTRKASHQTKYASDLEEQIKGIRAEKARLQLEDMVIVSKLNKEPFLKSNYGNHQARTASTLVPHTVYDPAKVQAYQKHLDSQIQHRHEQQHQYETEQKQLQGDYHPYGKPGNGAPLLNTEGDVKGGLKRNFYNDALDWLQLHERDTQPKVVSRENYKDELDHQRSENLAPLPSHYAPRATHQKELFVANMTHANQDKTSGLSLPLAGNGNQMRNRRESTGEYYVPIPKTDVVMRPQNTGQLINIHQRSDEDYNTYNGMAFGRPGAGAPVLDPLMPTVIDAHFKGVHTPIKIYHEPQQSNNLFQSTYQSSYASAVNSNFASARASAAATPSFGRSRSQSVSNAAYATESVLPVSQVNAALESWSGRPTFDAGYELSNSRKADGVGKSLQDIQDQLFEIEQTSRALQQSVNKKSTTPLSRGSFAIDKSARAGNVNESSLAPVRVGSGNGGYAQAYASKLRSRSNSVNANSFKPTSEYIAHKPTPIPSQRHSRQNSVSSYSFSNSRNSYALPRL